MENKTKFNFIILLKLIKSKTIYQFIFDSFLFLFCILCILADFTSRNLTFDLTFLSSVFDLLCLLSCMTITIFAIRFFFISFYLLGVLSKGSAFKSSKEKSLFIDIILFSLIYTCHLDLFFLRDNNWRMIIWRKEI